MHSLSPADELAEIRAAMVRLAAREAILCQTADALSGGPVSRPGWPIQRGSVHPQPAREMHGV